MKRWKSGYSRETVARAADMVRTGVSAGDAARGLQVPRGTVDSWIHRWFGGVEALRRRRKPITAEGRW